MMKPMLGLSLHVSMPVCVHDGGVWATAGIANVATAASAAKTEKCFNINVSL
jgi:hypothetical protein